MMTNLKFKFTLIAKNHGYWKIVNSADFSEYLGRFSVDNSDIGQSALELFCDSEYFPKIFYEDPVEFIVIERVE
jgi:hypothetical protein